MNILRWKRKSRKKIKLKNIILLIFSLIMSTFAWFAYTRVLRPTLNLHIASWDMEYYIGETKKTNPIGIEIPTIYPAMPEQTVTIDIKNNGERIVDIEYYVQTITIAGVTYEIVQEGATPTQENYIVMSPSVLEMVEVTEPETDTDAGANGENGEDSEADAGADADAGVEVVSEEEEEASEPTYEYIYKGAITNDITRFPFTIEIEHSAQIEPVSVAADGTKIPGDGYLKVSVNWIGDNDELDSEWGYIVGEYLSSEGATSVISIQLSIESYQAEGPIEQLIITQLPSTTTTNPYLPTGFARVPGTTLETGIVIKDASGNEYVWIEVPKTDTVYPTAGLSITSFTTEEYTKIENDLNTYTATYNTGDDIYSSYRAIGLAEENYDALKQKMLKSIYQNGGFYIGRYETGIENSFRTAATETDPTETPVIKANAYPYNWVTCGQAQTVAAKLAPTGCTTSLMFGLQWDLVLKYLETKGAVSTELTTDSTSWGNYNNSMYNITRANAKYSLNNAASWLVPPYEKENQENVVLTTGASSSFIKQNIYDLAGNLTEWTLNISVIDTIPYGGNGGNYTLSGSNAANYRANYIATTAINNIGFRVALF